MPYAVKEIFYSLQGEGHHTGRPAVFVRFAGCNLWTGREEDRAMAVCSFCDTDFVGTNGPGGAKFGSAEQLVSRISEVAGADSAEDRLFVVCTGGEPLLQLDDALVGALHASNCEVAVETNGTIRAPEGIDWLCVSPKRDAQLLQTRGDELKLVWFQKEAPPEKFAGLEFDHFYLQPMDGPDLELYTNQVVAYCKAHPIWKLSLQTHKMLGIR